MSRKNSNNKYQVKEVFLHGILGKDLYFGVFDTSNVPNVPITAFLANLVKFSKRGDAAVRSAAHFLCLFMNEVYSKSNIGSFEKVEADDLLIWLDQQAERGNAGFTVKMRLVTVNEFYSWAQGEGYLRSNHIFFSELPNKIQNKIKRKKALTNSTDKFSLFKRFIPEYDFKEILANIPCTRRMTQKRNELFFRLGYEVGLRRAEIVDHNNFSKSRLDYAISKEPHKGRKGIELVIGGKGSKKRKVHIPSTLLSDIYQYINDYYVQATPERREYFFARKVEVTALGQISIADYRPQYLSECFKKALRCFTKTLKGELRDRYKENDRYLSFHCTRHSYATNFAAWLRIEGQPITRLKHRMGHSHIDTTKAYVHFEALLAGDQVRANEYEPKEYYGNIMRYAERSW